MTIVTTEILVNTSIKTAYRAFTVSTSMREWLCDVATVDPHPNGRIYMWWRGDFYSSGHFLEVEENKHIKFRWYGNSDPAPTEVTVTFTEKGKSVNIRLEHEAPDDKSWKEATETFRHNWEESFENLKSVLETGVDKRIADRPMLGIAPGDFTEEQAMALKVPVRDGLRLDGLVEGMGAAKAGLQKDDVLVGMAGKPLTDFNSLAVAITGKKGGDKVEVVFYRGPEKKTVMMELSKRPMPEVPFDQKELEKRARELYEPSLAELEACFKNVSDAQAMKRPEAGEWSALEILAHLIHQERFNISYLAGLIDGNEPVYDAGGSNVDAQVEATVRANPSVALMLSALRRSVEEVLAMTAFIPDDFVQNNKASYYRYGFGLLQPNFHISGHLPQIKAALAAE